MRQPIPLLIAMALAMLSSQSAVSAASAIPQPTNIRVTTIAQLNNEEQCFISPVDTNVIISVWRDFRLGYRQIGIGRSTDGGATWTDSLISLQNQYINIVTGFAEPNKAWQSDPTLTVDRNGNFIMSVLDFSPTAPPTSDTSVIAFYVSSDQGLSWSGPFPNVTQFGAFFEDKQFITADRTGGPHDGNVYVSWTRFPNPDRIMFQRSTDGGQTFGDTITVGPAQTSTGCGGSVIDAGQFSLPVVNSNGDVHDFWLGIRLDSSVGCFGGNSIKHAVSIDGGQSFSAEDNIIDVSGWTNAAGGINTYSQPVVDADISGGPFDGRMYLCFTNIGPEDPGRSDVDFMVSDDNAATWTPRTQVNDFSSSSQADAFHPWLVVNQEGVVAMIFYDNREDPPFYTKFDLFAAYSYDGGATVTTNHRITTASSDPAFLASANERRPPVEYREGIEDPDVARLMSPQAGLIGEYIGLSMQWDKLNATWTDSRDFNSEVYTANWYLPLLEPRLIFPADLSTATADPQLGWATSWKNTDDRYRYEVATDAGFSSVVASATVDTPFVDLSGLSDGQYFWRVKSFKISTSDSSEYSTVFSFSVDAGAPSIPALLTPPDGTVAEFASPFFDWEDAFDAISSVTYELQVSTDAAFTPGPATTVYPGLTISEFGGVDPLPDSALVFWRVITSDDAGNTSTSAVFTYTYTPNCCLTPGDGDGSGSFNIGDVTFGIDRIFGGGPPAGCCAEIDADGNGMFNIGDITYGIAHIFSGGAAPICGPLDTGC